MTAANQSGSLSDHRNAYAAWRERMRNGVKSNKLIDLTREEEPEVSSEWAPDALFSSTDDELVEARAVVASLIEQVQATAGEA